MASRCLLHWSACSASKRTDRRAALQAPWLDCWRMGSLRQHAIDAYLKCHSALTSKFPFARKLYRIVIAPDQQPRFGDLCQRCGRSGASERREDIAIQASPGLVPGARLGLHCLSVPRCWICRTWEVAAFVGFWLPLVVILSLWIPNVGSHSGHRYSVRPSWNRQHTEIAVFCITYGMLVLACASRAWRTRVQVFERAEGISYVFAQRSVAEAFARRNEPLLPRTSPEFRRQADEVGGE